MTINQQSMNKKTLNTNTGLSGLGKLTWSALGLSAMLALSACSGGDNTAAEDTAPVSDTETEVVEVEEVPVVEAETVEVVEPVEETEVPVETAEAEVAAEPEVLAADAGAKLYEAQCKMCHEGGLLDAPKFGDKTDWAPHLVKDIDTLHMHSAKGFNKMPAQASDTVSEAQVHAAVDYMVAAVS